MKQDDKPGGKTIKWSDGSEAIKLRIIPEEDAESDAGKSLLEDQAVDAIIRLTP